MRYILIFFHNFLLAPDIHLSVFLGVACICSGAWGSGGLRGPLGVWFPGVPGVPEFPCF